MVAAYSTCDYGRMLEKIGNLIRRLYNVAPIEAASAMPKLDLRKTEAYEAMESAYQGFRTFMLDQANFLKDSNN